MKGFDVLKVKSAVKQRNKFDLSRSHLTTMDFGQIVPLFVEETVPGDKFKVFGEYFSRMAPLVKPTYGKFSFKTVSAFVPYHQVAWDSDAFFAGKTSWEGTTPHIRYILMSDLVQYFMDYCFSSGTSASFDFSYMDSNNVLQYRKLTTKGKYYLKVLNALGYTLPQVDNSVASQWTTVVKNMKLNALPLLAFFKLYNDYMSQSQRFNTSALSTFLQGVKYGKSVTGFIPSTGAINKSGIKTMFDNLLLNYENDYFTSAWATPNNAISNQENINGLNVPGSLNTYNEKVLSTFEDNRLLSDTDTVNGTSITAFGQRALDFLRSFDDWVRRNNYSGSRAVQQVYSRFGIKTDDYRSHYANVISTDTMPVAVGDVTAVADSSNVPLGDYAGKGIMNGSKGFDVSVSDYGLIIVLGYFTVVPMNSFGFDRRVLRVDPLDFYNPEFDGIGADAISLGEVYSSPRAVADGDQTGDNQVFGFTERYNSYRYGRDVISGEFRDYRSNGDMNTWHTGRNLAAVRKAGNLVAQSSSMNTLAQTDSEYNRIFSVTSGTVDHFYMTARFNVSAVRPMLNLNQVVRLGEGDTAVPRNGNVIN